MNSEMVGQAKYTQNKKPFDWEGLAKKTAVVGATGTLIGILGYGFYTTVNGHALNNVRAMGMRVGAQFAIVAAGLSYYCVREYGTPSEMYARYQATGKFFSAPENMQASLARPHGKHEQL